MDGMTTGLYAPMQTRSRRRTCAVVGHYLYGERLQALDNKRLFHAETFLHAVACTTG